MASMSDHGPAPRTRRVLYLAWAMTIVLAVASIGVWFWLSPSPGQLLQQGLSVMRRDPTRSELLLRRALNTKGGNYPDAQIALATLLTRRRAWTEASAMTATVDLQTCRPDLLLAFGREVLEQGHRAEAHRILEALSQRSGRESITALELLQSDCQDWGQDDKAVAIATELTQREPQNPQFWSCLIQLLARLGRDADCVSAIRAAQKTDLSQQARLESQDVLVSRLINLGDIPGVRSELARLRQAEGESVRVQGHQVYLSRLEGKLDQALETISQLVSSLSRRGSVPPFAYFTRGVIYLDLRRFEESAEDLKRVVAVEPFNAPAHFKLSEVYRGLGQDRLALDHRNIAADIAEKQKRISALLKQRQTDPRNEMLYLELAQLHRDLGDLESAGRWQQWVTRIREAK